MDLAAEAEARGVSKSELRDERAREELEPLDRGERPLVVTIGAVISLLIAASIIIAWLAGVEVQVGNTDINERPSAFQVFPPAILFTVMGIGMLRARYWAVLGFQAIMAIIMIGAFLTLIAAATIFQAPLHPDRPRRRRGPLLVHDQGPGADPDARARRP